MQEIDNQGLEIITYIPCNKSYYKSHWPGIA